jgi:peroxiredoxin
MKTILNLNHLIKRIHLVLISLLLINVSCSSDSSASATGTPTGTGTGTGTGNGTTTKAPDFTLNSLDNGQIKLSNYSDKVVVLFFLGSTCPNCISAAPSIQSKLATPYASNSNYAILGLDQWDGNTNAVQSFKNTTGVSFPLLLIASPVAVSYKTTYDRLVVIDKSGNIAFSGTRGAASDVDTVKAKVDELLK